jgi:hypothetical protein
MSQFLRFSIQVHNTINFFLGEVEAKQDFHSPANELRRIVVPEAATWQQMAYLRLANNDRLILGQPTLTKTEMAVGYGIAAGLDSAKLIGYTMVIQNMINQLNN